MIWQICIVHDARAYENCARWFCPVDQDCVVVSAIVTIAEGEKP